MHKKQIIIWLMAGFLITYHTVKIYSGLVANDDAAAAVLNWSLSNSLRLWIIASLLLVIMFKRLGVLSMWLSISSLVLLQYMNMTGNVTFLSYLGPLKGFIFPAAITMLFWQNQKMSTNRS